MKIVLLVACAAFFLPGAHAQQKTYTIAFLNKKSESQKVDEETTRKLMEGHMANIRRLAEEGKLLVAGPFDGGGGIFIFNTTSPEEAQSWLNSDPAVQANRWMIEILPYTPRVGSVCPIVGDINMVAYTFVRFNVVVQKFTAANYPDIIRQHHAWLKNVTAPLDVVTEAVFGPNEGGILIIDGELSSDVFADDPGVQQGLIDADVKKLYVAKSSFCEN